MTSMVQSRVPPKNQAESTIAASSSQREMGRRVFSGSVIQCFGVWSPRRPIFGLMACGSVVPWSFRPVVPYQLVVPRMRDSGCPLVL